MQSRIAKARKLEARPGDETQLIDDLLSMTACVEIQLKAV
jgi:hypothetical protein